MITRIKWNGASGMTWGKSLDAFVRDTEGITKILDKGVEKIIDATADKLVKESVKRTPVDTGKAKRSWATSQKLSARNTGRKKRIHVFNTARTAKNNRTGWFYIRLVNDGTQRIKPRRFFEKAIAVTAKYQEKRLQTLIKRLSK